MATDTDIGACGCCGVPDACLAANCPGRSWPATIHCTIGAGGGGDSGCCGVTTLSVALTWTDPFPLGIGCSIAGGVGTNGYTGTGTTTDGAGKTCVFTVYLQCQGTGSWNAAVHVSTSGGSCTVLGTACDGGPFGVTSCSPFSMTASTMGNAGSLGCPCFLTLTFTD